MTRKKYPPVLYVVLERDEDGAEWFYSAADPTELAKVGKSIFALRYALEGAVMIRAEPTVTPVQDEGRP